AFRGEAAPVTYESLGRASGAFERRLVPPSRFDAFLAGQDQVLSEEELEGLALFLDVGCTTCHNGPGVGGRLFQKLGLVKPYPTADPGRAKVTGQAADPGFFQVPSRRNAFGTA